jgi:hypothetical protein
MSMPAFRRVSSREEALRLERATSYQATAEKCARIARSHIIGPVEYMDRAAARWYQIEAAAEYRGARGLMNIKESDYAYA